MLLGLRPRIALVGLALATGLASCSSPPLAVTEPKVDQADDQQATCKVAKDPMNPMIIEWPGTSKVDFDVRSQSGLVAVSYAGCTLKVLPRCNIGGKYTLKTVTPARDRFEMSTVTDLYARLPLGAASLRAELAHGASLDLDYVAVGQRVADSEPVPGTGTCDGATHYIQSITVGAYSLDAHADGAAGAGVEVAGIGAGAKRTEAVKHVRGSGSVDGCAAKPDAAGCNAVIQIGLAELPTAQSPTATTESRCPAGMAEIPGSSSKFVARLGEASVSPFCLDKTEVTVDAYAACVRSGACSDADVSRSEYQGTWAVAPNCNWGVAGHGQHPMNCVDYAQAAAYCASRGKRLPTEAEWEWAARGGDEARPYPWGAAPPKDQACWSQESPRTSTCAVASFPQGDGRWGVHDLLGNVWEFTAPDRVFRGGEFGNVGYDAKSIVTGYQNDPAARGAAIGFRCAQ